MAGWYKWTFWHPQRSTESDQHDINDPFAVKTTIAMSLNTINLFNVTLKQLALFTAVVCPPPPSFVRTQNYNFFLPFPVHA
jgi:hypothetical protein